MIPLVGGNSGRWDVRQVLPLHLLSIRCRHFPTRIPRILCLSKIWDPPQKLSPDLFYINFNFLINFNLLPTLSTDYENHYIFNDIFHDISHGMNRESTFRYLHGCWLLSLWPPLRIKSFYSGTPTAKGLNVRHFHSSSIIVTFNCFIRSKGRSKFSAKWMMKYDSGIFTIHALLNKCIDGHWKIFT